MKNKKGDYIPSNKMEFIAWLLNFLKKLTKYVNHYGINEEQIKIAQPQADVFKEDMAIELEILNAKLAQFKKSEKDRKAIEKTCRKIANVIKADFDYTEDIGREFGIIGPEKEMDEENPDCSYDFEKIYGKGWNKEHEHNMLEDNGYKNVGLKNE